MGRYRKILVAIDGSSSSMHALRESFKLALQEKSWITVLSVVPHYQGDLDTLGVGDIMASMRKPCEDALSEAGRIAEAERIMIRTVCEEGETFGKIIDIADAENFDLIVMGRRGLKRLERALVGSVTARVIGYSSKDVLVVPQNTVVGWQKILLATDGSKYSHTAAEKAIDVAKSYGSELTILSVVDVPAEFYGEDPEAWDRMISKAKEYAGKAKQQAEMAGVKAEAIVRQAEAFQAITGIAKEQKINAIIMGSHGRTGLKRLLMGSVTEKVIGYAPCPVLIVKG